MKNYSQYIIYLNNEKIALDTIYLDKKNIQSVVLNKKKLDINIVQKNKNAEYLLLAKVCADSSSCVNNCRCLIIIDGCLVNEKTKIEKNAVKDIKYLSPDNTMTYKPVLLISANN
ncbi:MAG: hypothetical protein LBD45_00780 [Bacteroidales bacterium]|nr:hypothetical protein [Bacteroidales bacterium]